MRSGPASSSLLGELRVAWLLMFIALSLLGIAWLSLEFIVRPSVAVGEQTRDWPTVEATVESFEVFHWKENPGASNPRGVARFLESAGAMRYAAPKLRFHYQVDGKRYEQERLVRRARKSSEQADLVRRWIEQNLHKVRDASGEERYTTTIHVSPANPALVAFIPGAPGGGSIWMSEWIGIPAFFCFVGVAVFFIALWRFRVERRQFKPTYASPLPPLPKSRPSLLPGGPGAPADLPGQRAETPAAPSAYPIIHILSTQRHRSEWCAGAILTILEERGLAKMPPQLRQAREGEPDRDSCGTSPLFFVHDDTLMALRIETIEGSPLSGVATHAGDPVILVLGEDESPGGSAEQLQAQFEAAPSKPTLIVIDAATESAPSNHHPTPSNDKPGTPTGASIPVFRLSLEAAFIHGTPEERSQIRRLIHVLGESLKNR